MITSDPDYEILATRIIASNIQKTAPKSFYEAMTELYNAGIVTKEVKDVSFLVNTYITP